MNLLQPFSGKEGSVSKAQIAVCAVVPPANGGSTKVSERIMMTPNEKQRFGDGRDRFQSHGDVEYVSKFRGSGGLSKGLSILSERLLDHGVRSSVKQPP